MGSYLQDAIAEVFRRRLDEVSRAGFDGFAYRDIPIYESEYLEDAGQAFGREVVITLGPEDYRVIEEDAPVETTALAVRERDEDEQPR